MAAAVLDPSLAAGVLDQDAAHRFGRSGKEMSPAVPVLRFLPVHEADVDFMNQGRRLEGLPCGFLGHLLRRESAQFVVDLRQQLLGGVRVALFNGGQDAGYVTHRPPKVRT